MSFILLAHIKSHQVAVFFFENDTGLDRGAKLFLITFILHQLYQFGVTFLDLVKLLPSNIVTTGFQNVDQFTVVVGEEDVGNNHLSNFLQLVILELVVLVSLADLLTSGLVIMHSRMLTCKFCDELVSHQLFQFVLNGLLERKSLRNELVTLLVSFPCFVPLVVDVTINFPFHAVVTGSDSGHVPFHLLDLAALVQPADLDKEQQSDQDRKSFHSGQLRKLGRELLLCLDARELHEDSGTLTKAAYSRARLVDQIL